MCVCNRLSLRVSEGYVACRANIAKLTFTPRFKRVFLMCVGVLPSCTSKHHMHALCLQRLKEDIGFAGAGGTEGRKLLCGCWESNLGPLPVAAGTGLHRSKPAGLPALRGKGDTSSLPWLRSCLQSTAAPKGQFSFLQQSLTWVFIQTRASPKPRCRWPTPKELSGVFRDSLSLNALYGHFPLSYMSFAYILWLIILCF